MVIPLRILFTYTMCATEEERIKALRESRNKYQKNKEWYCDICYNGKN